MTPIIPSMPGHRSIRPYTVFELEQVRQQSRKYGTVGSWVGQEWGGGDLTETAAAEGTLGGLLRVSAWDWDGGALD